jgi:hypothetical protein
MQVYWHRRNLRPSPNPGLSTAFSAAERTESRVVPVFVLDDAILSRADGLGVAFMLGSLHALRDWYRDHGSDLVIRHGDPTDVVEQIARTVGVERVVWNSDRSRLARGRDRAVQRVLTRAGVAYTAVPSEQSHEAKSSTPPAAEPKSCLADPDALGLETGTVPRLSDLGKHGYDSAPLTVGTESAQKQLRALADGTTYRQCDDDSGFVNRHEAALDWA